MAQKAIRALILRGLENGRGAQFGPPHRPDTL
jgi:hypothetical protein